MPVIASKTEGRCKLCQSPHRSRIDELLYKRSRREQDAHGQQVNEQYVIRQLREWGVPNPTPDNLKVHWRKHCEVVASEELDVRQEAADAVTLAIRAGDQSVIVGPDEALDWIVTQGMAEARARVALDGKAGITVDQTLKAIDSQTKRRSNEAQRDALDALGRGLGAVFGAVARGVARESLAPVEEPLELEAVEEAEILLPADQDATLDVVIEDEANELPLPAEI